MSQQKTIRFFIDPQRPECGETIIKVENGWVDISYERPARLIGPPYFCPSLDLRSCQEELPNCGNYSYNMRYDWSDMEVDTELGARVPFYRLAEVVLAQMRDRLQSELEELRQCKGKRLW